MSMIEYIGSDVGGIRVLTVELVDDRESGNNSAWWAGHKGEVFQVINSISRYEGQYYYVVENGIITNKLLRKNMCKILVLS